MKTIKCLSTLLLLFALSIVINEGHSIKRSESDPQLTAKRLASALLEPVANKRSLSSPLSFQYHKEIVYDHVNHYYGYQMMNGLPVYGTESSVHVAMNGNPRIVAKNVHVKRGEDVLIEDHLFTVDQIESLLNVVFRSLDVEPVNSQIVVESGDPLNGNFEVKMVEEEIGCTFEEVYFLEKNVISKVIVFKIDINHPVTQSWVVIIDTSERILRKIDTVHHVSYLVLPDSVGSPFGIGNPDQNTQLIDLVTIERDSLSQFASPLGWVYDEATEGNNAFAYLDLTSPDGFNASMGDIGVEFSAPGEFHYPVDFNTVDASDNRIAATVQAFYAVNYIHDIVHHFGFDEVSGNFQMDNFGRGGVEGDSVLVEVQDYSGFDNANFETPADGKKPRMQLFLTQGGTTILESNGDFTTFGSASFGPRTFEVVADSVLPNGDNLEACNPIIADVTGKIVVVDRGNCPFVTKVANVQNAGAIAVVVCNNIDEGSFSLGGNDPTLNIPVAGVSLSFCQTSIKPSISSSIYMKSGSITRDTAFSKDIIYHEYGHGISFRLVGAGMPGCGFGFTTESASEGIADYYGIALTDDGNITVFGIGNWAFFGGIRPAPYQIGNGYLYGEFFSPGIHDVGFYFCNFLVDLHLSLRDKFGYEPLVDFLTSDITLESYEYATTPPIEYTVGDITNVLYQQTFSNDVLLSDWTTSMIQESSMELTDWVWYEIEGEGFMYIDGVSEDNTLCNSPEFSLSSVRSLISPTVNVQKNGGKIYLKLNHEYRAEVGYDGGNLKLILNGNSPVLIPSSNIIGLGYSETATDNLLEGEGLFSGFIEVSPIYILLDDMVSDGDNIQIQFDFVIDCCCGDSFWAIIEIEIFEADSVTFTLLEPDNHLEAHGTQSDMPGNWISMLLVTDSLKLVDCVEPHFLAHRDSLLAASQYNFAEYPHHIIYCLIWDAAAGRGMGWDASAGTMEVNDETQDFKSSPNCRAPEAVSDSFSIFAEETSFPVTDNDWLGIRPSVITIDQNPTNGTVIVSGKTIIFTPSFVPTECYDDTFFYTVTDSYDRISSTDVTFTVCERTEMTTTVEISSREDTSEDDTGITEISIGNLLGTFLFLLGFCMI